MYMFFCFYLNRFFFNTIELYINLKNKDMVALETIKVLFGVFTFLCAQSHSFTVDIIPRHSPNSPFHKSSKPSSAKFATGVEYDASDYMIKFSIGTPPVERFAVMDTGSDLTWTQCEPCRGVCFPQDMPFFDASKSSSYTRLPCDAPICREGGVYSCDASSGLCHYDLLYGDASYTNGDLAYDTLAIGGASFPRFVFGCGVNNSGIYSHLITGIFGLGNGPSSFIKQANIERFSYCLPWYYEPNVSTRIAFGPDAVITGPNGVVSTPLVDSQFGYLITLENLSVGGKTLLSKPLEEPISSMLVDSGTTLTRLPDELYDALITELKSVVKGTPVSDPSGTDKLCYKASDLTTQVFPTVVAHFAGGAVVPFSLKAMLSYLVFDDGGVVCLPFEGGDNILGNLSQIDYIILFDLVAESISFMPAHCNHF
ncbi:hypothetical protein DM860_010304 [Cuscuta australis]|uniref:Peptidase A1 domain-containing protein n=1 Tax=Cuscuta australis TaxID=267555 RepID=A0A328D8L0_9ASTE|nr:hypothetical protein DM860_010304 [Cuscuta australis]